MLEKRTRDPRLPESGGLRMGSPWPANPSRVLSWIYLGRITVGAMLLVALPGDAFSIANESLYVTALLIAITVVTASSFIYTHSLGSRPSRLLLYSQIVFDAVLLTAIVYLTGGPYSMFTPLYILVISAGALLLPIVGGIAIGLFTSVLFFAAAAGTAGITESGILLQAALFATVAVVSGYLGDRLRQTGTALGKVQIELRRLRLDTDDILETIGTGILTVDEQGRLAYLNPAAAEMLSLDAGEWLDQPILEKLDSIAPGLGEVIERTANLRTPIRRFETTPLRTRSFWASAPRSSIVPTTERPPVTAIFQDITEKNARRGAAAPRGAPRGGRRAERLARPRDQEPARLDPQRGRADHRSGVDAEDARLLGACRRESDRLSRLLGEFIDFARVKVTAPQPVDFPASSATSWTWSAPTPTRTGVELHRLRVAERALAHPRGEDLLHRAVFNLALNAVQWAGRTDGELAARRGPLRPALPALGAFRLLSALRARLGPGCSGGDPGADLRSLLHPPGGWYGARPRARSARRRGARRRDLRRSRRPARDPAEARSSRSTSRHSRASSPKAMPPPATQRQQS
jgi:two-component system, NtrC family, sensor histidine kinase PilS